MTIAQTLETAINTALKNLNIPEVAFSIEHPSELSHGDFATNVAMVTAKTLGMSPREVAEKVVAEIVQQQLPEIASVEIAGPGFINFKLAPEFFTAAMNEILEADQAFGHTGLNVGKKILIEHSSPNLFKPFHIGHMMNNAIGESLVRIARATGADVTTMSFPSDISLGVARAIFVIIEKVPDGQLENPSIEILGDAYVEGTKRYDEDESIQARVKEIADNLYAKKDSPELTAFENCKRFNIDYFEHIVGKLGSHFDSYIYESEAGEVGKKIVLENTPRVFTESEGAIVYIPDESKKHINTSVFINSQGNPTYDAKDIGLLKLKFDIENWDTSLFVTDHEQIPHFNVVLDAAEKINPIWSRNSVHIAHGRMSFKGAKMSSRLGGVPLASELLETVGAEVTERSSGRELSQEMLDQVSIGAIKFSILRTKPGQNINFDPETSLSFEGDSGPYLQYTHARITTMLEKALNENLTPHILNDQEVSEIEKIAYRFPEVVTTAFTEYGPHHVVTYLLEVAHAFNSYYSAHKIIDAENKLVSEHRLAIARTTQIIIRNGLELLGISAPDKM